MPGEVFSVYSWFNLEDYIRDKYLVPWPEAESAIIRLCKGPVAKLGLTHKVMVTDGGDNCVFLWEKDKGVVFPKREEKPDNA